MLADRSRDLVLVFPFNSGTRPMDWIYVDSVSTPSWSAASAS
jgi:hypothetical protein